MERYNSYKDSGISWAAEIPSNWDFLAGKKLFIKNDGGVWGTDPLNDGKDTIVLRSTEQTVDGKLVIENPAKRCLSEKEKQGSLLEENDLIITKSSGSPAHIGKTSIITKEIAQLKCSYSNFIQRIRIKGCPMYYWFVFNSTLIKTQFDILTTTTTGLKNISAKIIDRVMLPLPPLAEQERIVSYLEDKTSKIDAYVADKEKEIELLQELKQKTIADAVTQGLNPNVKMKESKTPFFGLIPEHWEERKMKYCFSERSEKNHPEEPILCATQSQGVIPQSMYQNRVVVVNKGFEGLKFVKVGDFVISLRSFEGGIEYAYYQGIISAAYTILTPLDTDNADYFKLLFKCYPFIQVLQTCVTGIREGQNINYQMLGRKFIPIPPIEEQRAIVAHIENKCSKVNSLITELEAEIEYLKEYKQRLIADCVTGQVNVQNT